MIPTKLSAPYHLSSMPLVDRDTWILSRAAGLRVLHAGATDSMFTEQRASGEGLLHQKLRGAGCDLVGLDIDKEGIEYLRRVHGIDDIRHGDLESLPEQFEPQSFDLVIAADVLEHLNNPGLFLSGVREVLRSTGSLIVTVPNAFSLKKFLGVSLFRQERNHPDHVCFYSYMNLHEILRRFGFVITEANAFMLEDATRRINWYANLTARAAMLLLRNHHIADEIALLARPALVR